MATQCSGWRWFSDLAFFQSWSHNDLESCTSLPIKRLVQLLLHDYKLKS
jgi:hypothetical protein